MSHLKNAIHLVVTYSPSRLGQLHCRQTVHSPCSPCGKLALAQVCSETLKIFCDWFQELELTTTLDRY